MEQLMDGAVIVDGPMRGPRSGIPKYRFIVLEKGKLMASGYRYKTWDNAWEAGKRYLAG